MLKIYVNLHLFFGVFWMLIVAASPSVSLHNLRSFMYYIINVYRLSPFPVSQSPFTFVLNAEFAQYLIITTNFEFIVFSCCWKCPQHQLCCQSIRIILHLCASLLINSESSSIAHESSTKVKCTEIDFKYVSQF